MGSDSRGSKPNQMAPIATRATQRGFNGFNAGKSFISCWGAVVRMRTLLLTVMMLCACLFTAGCTGGEDEEMICEEEVTLTQYEVSECKFLGGESGYSELSIEMTSTGDSPVNIFTFNSDEYNNWIDCESFGYDESLSEMSSTGASIEGKIDFYDFYVVFDHPNSCDDEETSAIVEFSFKVTAS